MFIGFLYTMGPSQKLTYFVNTAVITNTVQIVSFIRDQLFKPPTLKRDGERRN